MTVRSPTRVLIIDNDPQVRSDLREILEPLGYHVQIAQGVGQDLMNQAIDLACGCRPHVAIVDVRLLDEYSDDRSGLQLLDSLRSASRVLYSAYLTPELTLEVIKGYDTTRWVSKHQSPQQLVDEVEGAARETSRGDLKLHRPSALRSQVIVEALFGHDSDVPLDLVDDTLGQLFPENQELTLRPLVGEAVSPFSVSRGRSVVSKAYPDDLEPVVVKLAPAEQSRNEDRNYQEHVKGRLVGQFSAQLERTVEFWDLGGTTYSFLGSSLRALPSFTVAYRDERDPQVILKSLRHFFKEVWSRHYSQPIAWNPPPLFQIYDEALRLRGRLESFTHQEDTLTFSGLPASFKNPIPWVLQRGNTSLFAEAQCAITHGDMHGDNLFTDGEHAWAIDFERTGPGHILRDFVELEVDILTRLVPFLNYDLSRFYELVSALMEPSQSLTLSQPTAQSLADTQNRKALEVITGLRRIAYEVTRCRDFREYLWGLLLDALFVTVLVSEDSPQRERALLLGAVLCESLQDWE
jgi:CheY-like chemotaxis protein